MEKILQTPPKSLELIKEFSKDPEHKVNEHFYVTEINDSIFKNGKLFQEGWEPHFFIAIMKTT